MQVALWVIAFTVIYVIITLVACVANSEYKGAKIPNTIGVLIMIFLYFVALPVVIDFSRSIGNATFEGGYASNASRGAINLPGSGENQSNDWGSKYGNENIRKAVRDEMIRNGSDPNMADAYTKLKYDEERVKNQGK